jgi:hypothetical protein
MKLTGLDKVILHLDSKLYTKVLSRTINDLGKKTVTSTTRDVRAQYNIKAKDIRKYIRVRKSSYGRLEYRIDISSKRRNVTHFGSKILKQKGKVSVLIKKEVGRKVLKRAFKAKNSPAILQRRKGSQEVSAITTLSVPQMFNSKTLDNAKKLNERESGKMFKKNFDYYIGRN